MAAAGDISSVIEFAHLLHHAILHYRNVRTIITTLIIYSRSWVNWDHVHIRFVSLGLKQQIKIFLFWINLPRHTSGMNLCKTYKKPTTTLQVSYQNVKFATSEVIWENLCQRLLLVEYFELKVNWQKEWRFPKNAFEKWLTIFLRKS